MCIRLFFILVFNTIIPFKVIVKHQRSVSLFIPMQLKPLFPHQHTTISTNRQQLFLNSHQHRSTWRLRTQSPALLYPYAHDCTTRNCSNVIFKFSNNTAFISQIIGNNKSYNWRGIDNPIESCQNDTLALNVSKTKDEIVYCRKGRQGSMNRPSSTKLWLSDSTASLSCFYLKICFSSLNTAKLW